ncbi:MAG: DUF1963 domain-containing protein [Pseudanabaenales cyanobacterium]|nr:DUF1963 domain-containing protein [Pseudanabaenales cyanobacterium]
MREKIRQLLDKHGLRAHSEGIEELLAPAIHISKLYTDVSEIGISRIGGSPDVPANFKYPYWKDEPLGFLAQINCSDLTNYDTDNVLPHHGMLYFFYNIVEQPWGYDPEDRGCSAVIYIPVPETLNRSRLPLGFKAEKVCLKAFRISFKIVPSLPNPNASTPFDFEGEGFDKADIRNYFNLLEDLEQQYAPRPSHQLLGHADTLQNDMQKQCQLVSHGFYLGGGISAGSHNPYKRVLEAGASEWRLLCQFDSDIDAEAQWGDMGLLFFWIRKSALRERQFGEICTILQC